MLFIKRTRLLIGVLAVGFMMSSILIPSVALAVPSSQGGSV
jgi:hypothetical protein